MVMKSTKQSPENICGFMFGEACDNPVGHSTEHLTFNIAQCLFQENPLHEWSYSLPPPSSNAIHLKKTAKLISPGARVKRHDHHQTLTVLHISDTHWDPLYREGTLANCKDFLCCREDSGEVRGWDKQIHIKTSIKV